MQQDPENTGADAQIRPNLLEKPGSLRARGCGREAHQALLADFRGSLLALNRASATIAATLYPLPRFLAFLHSRGLDLRAVRALDIEAYLAELRAARVGKAGATLYSPHTVDGYLRAVKRFYAWLEQTGKVLLSPVAGLPMPRVRGQLPHAVLTASEIKRLLEAPDTSMPIGIRDKAMLEVFYSTGLRLGELCALTVHDLDLSNGFLRVNAGKGGRDRVVPMGRKAAQYLQEYLRHVRGRFTTHRRDERALFVGIQGRRINRQTVEGLVRIYARTAGIRSAAGASATGAKRVTPHALRHTCATHMLSGGADVVHVQHLLGHASIDTTQLYTRVACREVKATHARSHPRERNGGLTSTQPPAPFRDADVR